MTKTMRRQSILFRTGTVGLFQHVVMCKAWVCYTRAHLNYPFRGIIASDFTVKISLAAMSAWSKHLLLVTFTRLVCSQRKKVDHEILGDPRLSEVQWTLVSRVDVGREPARLSRSTTTMIPAYCVYLYVNLRHEPFYDKGVNVADPHHSTCAEMRTLAQRPCSDMFALNNHRDYLTV